ncbi:hypothetical protein [Pedobacter sp. Leaf132]|uniref:hypothetical protein n=1 Tax=Pedobacter sp. Leaf132 TaxID=2876557 RepID=UPI001E4F467F|nr:hypothetical protein [Pedobacter sp. Leaf132]
MKAYFFLFLFFTFNINLCSQTYFDACVILTNTGVFGTTFYTTATGITSSGIPNGQTGGGACNPGNIANLPIAEYSGAISFSGKCLQNSLNPSYNYRNCKVGGLCGIRMNTTIINCPIDDYISLLFLVAGVLGFLYIRKFSMQRFI